MGRGFGRGAKSVAIVTHAQMKGKAKKLPKGLRGGKKKARRARHEQDPDDPNRMLNTRVRDGPSPAGGAGGKKPSSTMERLDAQIASIQFKELVNGKGRLKNLRKQIIQEVKGLRRKHHKRQEKANQRDQKRLAEAHGEALEARSKARGPRQARRRAAAPETDSD